MTTIQRIPSDRLDGLDIQEGDTLRILSSDANETVVEIQRHESGSVLRSDALADWVRTARGSVKIGPAESDADVRMAYYTEKYNLDR
jgi:hypothetical protein